VPVHKPLDAARLRGLVSYDPDSGELRWLHKRGPCRAGDLAGHTHKSDRRVAVGIDGKLYRAHRLIWLYVFGEWPRNDIDHINGNPLDNRLCNLRDVSKLVNQQNHRRPGKRNTSGYLGVSWHSAVGLWRACVRVEGRQKFLGVFLTPEEAYAAYLAAKRQLHEGCTI
jgi:hypothetical protein